jgi:hypothetical protein
MKQYFIGLFVVGMIVTISAFAYHEAPAKENTRTAVWFEYLGGTGGETTAENYQQYDPQPESPPCDASNNKVCAILIEPDGSGLPDFDHHSPTSTRWKP